MTPQEWASAANKLSRANPGLTRAEIITRMNLQGMPRPTGVESKGTDSKGNPRFGKKTRSQGQTARRKQHEQTSTSEAQQQLEALQQWQQTMNNMAAAAGMEGTNLEHAYPSDQAGDVIQDRGRAGDYTYLNSDSDAAWKTALEQYIRSYKDNRYRLLRGNYGDRIVDTRYADDLVDPQDLPGMDVDPSMTPEQIFTALPILVRQDLSMRQTQFPGQAPLPGLTTTAGKAQWKPPALPGFDTSEQPGPTVTAPQGGGYYAPQVMEVNGENGENGKNGKAAPVTIEPPSSGNGGNGNGADYTAQNVQQLLELGKQLSNASLTIRAGKAVWGLVKTAGLVAASYALK